MRPVHLQPPTIPYARVPAAYGPAVQPFYAGATSPVSMYVPRSPAQPMYAVLPYAPAASPSHQHSYFNIQPPSVPRYPIKQFMRNPFQASPSQYSSVSAMFDKIKPFLFGNTGPRSLPHHPFQPNMYPPYHFKPNRPLHNRPIFHNSYPIQHEVGASMGPEKSCSCSLHVGQITVYKHTDVRSSYSCSDLKDCNDFCTNLFSSEDLRAQTRADACLILGKDVTVPWFRRDAVCEPNGVKNDTKLSVDLCCKNLQPC